MSNLSIRLSCLNVVPLTLQLNTTFKIPRALRGCGYIFKRRGQMDVKGKGIMSTYFLCGHHNRLLNDPHDEFTELPLHRDADEGSKSPDISRLSQETLNDERIFADTENGVSNVNNLQNPENGNDIDSKSCSRNYENVRDHQTQPRSESNNICGSSERLASFGSSHRRVSIKKSNIWLSNENNLISSNVPFLDGNSKMIENSLEAANAQSSSKDANILYDEGSVCSDDVTQTEHREISNHGSQHSLVSCGLATGEIHRPQNLTLYNTNCPDMDTSTDCCELKVGSAIPCHSRPFSSNNAQKFDIQIVRGGLIHTTLTVTPTVLEAPHLCSSISKSETFPIAASGQQLKPRCTPSRSQGTLSLRSGDRSKKVKKHHSKLCLVA